jgi:hypothetical protein
MTWSLHGSGRTPCGITPEHDSGRWARNWGNGLCSDVNQGMEAVVGFNISTIWELAIGSASFYTSSSHAQRNDCKAGVASTKQSVSKSRYRSFRRCKCKCNEEYLALFTIHRVLCRLLSFLRPILNCRKSEDGRQA